jgi:hypothetical protein
LSEKLADLVEFLLRQQTANSFTHPKFSSDGGSRFWRIAAKKNCWVSSAIKCPNRFFRFRAQFVCERNAAEHIRVPFRQSFGNVF